MVHKERNIVIKACDSRHNYALDHAVMNAIDAVAKDELLRREQGSKRRHTNSQGGTLDELAPPVEATEGSDDYLAQLDKELSKIPVAVEIEKRTKVPKAYIFGGAGAILFLLILLNFWGNFLTTLLGFVWPAYQSFKAIESVNKDDDRQWLTYWCVFGFLNVIEFFSDIVLYWIPFYYAFKAGFIIYLILPQTRGAIVVYNSVVKPYLLKGEGSIDDSLAKLKNSASAAAAELTGEKRD
ncbi:ER membrane protein DP1/Yop1 [Phlyctochytrium bullatum]|nr:ER membrane protein DP1/Yop1 [Phlyctochytrium bullatum]